MSEYRPSPAPQLADRGDPRVVARLVAAAGDGDASVREAALRAVETVAAEHDQVP
jgi:hypothetical protein